MIEINPPSPPGTMPDLPEPHLAHLAADFACKTDDFPVLSVTDLRVLARSSTTLYHGFSWPQVCNKWTSLRKFQFVTLV